MKNVKIRIMAALVAAATIVSFGTISQNVYAEDTTASETQDAAAESNVNISVSESAAEESNIVNPTFTITNTSESDLDLTTLRIRYYYTEDSDVDQKFNCYYAGTISGNYSNITSYVQGSLVKMDEDKQTEDADSYMELTFNGGTLEAGQSMTLITAVNKENWSVYNKKNDYSFNNSGNIAAYINGEIVSGQEPAPAEDSNNLGTSSVEIYNVINLGGRSASIAPTGDEVFASVEGLEEGKDYLIDTESNTIVMLADYMQKVYNEGGAKIQFNYISGKYETLIINVKPYNTSMTGTFSSEAQTVKRGDKVTIPVKLSLDGTPDSGLNVVAATIDYNPEVFTDAQITAGNIDAAEVSFAGDPVEEVGIDGKDVTYFSFQLNAEDYGDIYEELAKTDNIVYMTFTVKDDAPLGETSLHGQATDLVGLAADGSTTQYKPVNQYGNITVTEK